MTPVSWEEAPEVREIAHGLIQDHHRHLEGQPLHYLFRSTAAKGKGGASRPHRIVAKGKLDVALSADPRWQGCERYYVIEIPKTLWHRWSEAEREAQIDIALSRLISGQSSLQVRDLELRDLAPIIKRHGLYDQDLVGLAKTLRQYELPFEAPANGNGHSHESDDLGEAESFDGPTLTVAAGGRTG